MKPGPGTIEEAALPLYAGGELPTCEYCHGQPAGVFEADGRPVCSRCVSAAMTPRGQEQRPGNPIPLPDGPCGV